MRNYEKMGKTDLRAACKAAGISYGKMSVAEMRAALGARTPAATTPAPVAAPVVPHPVVAVAAKPQASKPKVAKVEREQRNGVKKPGPGKCLDVWNWCDSFKKDTGSAPDAAAVREWAQRSGANVSNATQEMSRWRKFSGLTKPAKTGKGVMAKAA